MTELRSDTFTKPSAAMLEDMFRAQVGDDVFGEDPTVNKLEKMTADMFGMEAAMFCPSGTMTNQIGIKVHTRPGEEVICEEMSHVYIYEGGGIASNSSCQVKPIKGNFGLIHAEQVEAAINPVNDVHRARTSLVSLENTANRGGGSCYEWADLEKIRETCNKHQLALHLDGARLWNALVEKKQMPKQYGQLFDSISVCLSKGLGAPVGSLLLGKADYISEARRVRKRLGGGMRQAGYLAAAGIYALENNIARLAEDHAHARRVADTWAKKDFIGAILPVETNILIFEVLPPFTAVALVAQLAEKGIKCVAISSTQIRMVFHLDVTVEMVGELDKLIDGID